MEDGGIKLKGKGATIGLTMLIGIVVILFVLYYLDNRNRRDIMKDFEKTFGILTKYEDASSIEGSNVIIEYSFTVNSKVYSRRTHTMHKFKKCQDNPLNCIGKKYWVIYQRNHPENSLVDIEIEIEGENSNSF